MLSLSMNLDKSQLNQQSQLSKKSQLSQQFYLAKKECSQYRVRAQTMQTKPIYPPHY